LNRRFWVYIITNYTNTVLYTGMTNNLQRRLSEHKAGINPKSFSKQYRLYKLIWFQEFSSRLEAARVEKKIKGWIRAKKIALIKESNPGFRDMSTLR